MLAYNDTRTRTYGHTRTHAHIPEHTQEIDDEIANQIIGVMLYLDSEDNTKPIYLYINCPGGSVIAGMAAASVSCVMYPTTLRDYQSAIHARACTHVRAVCVVCRCMLESVSSSKTSVVVKRISCKNLPSLCSGSVFSSCLVV